MKKNKRICTIHFALCHKCIFSSYAVGFCRCTFAPTLIEAAAYSWILQSVVSQPGHAVLNGCCRARLSSLRICSKMHAAQPLTAGDKMAHFGGPNLLILIIDAIFVQRWTQSSGILSFAKLLCPMEQKFSNEVFGLACFCCGQVQIKSLAVFSVLCFQHCLKYKF